MYVKVLSVRDNQLPLPTYANSGDAGFDLRADLSDDILLRRNKELSGGGTALDLSGAVHSIEILPGCRMLIPTGIKMEIPEGYELQVRSRSGLALKFGIMVLNSPGTVDAGYRGEIGVILFNTSNEPFIVRHGDRIAQGVFNKFEPVTLAFATELSDSDRGAGGFGASGVK